MSSPTRRADDLARTIAKLQRRVDALPVHSHSTQVQRWEKASTQNVPSGGGLTTLTTSTPQFGGSSLWSMTAGVITINVAGVYVVNVGVRWEANNTGQRISQITQNGAGRVADRRPAISLSESNISTRVDAAVNDTIEHKVNQTSGGALDAGGDQNTFIEIELVGRL